MNMPGFVAELSVYKSIGYYSRVHYKTATAGVYPAQAQTMDCGSCLALGAAVAVAGGCCAGTLGAAVPCCEAAIILGVVFFDSCQGACA